ncbi:hypothetical protein Tco_0362647 [Tanacetum coccineum]
MHHEDVMDHIATILEMLNLINIPGVDSHQLRMKIFPLSLADDARQWWINKGEGKITTWEELVEKFFYKFYPESYDGEEEMLDKGNNWGVDPLEFISWIKNQIQAAHDRQKSYADLRRKPLEFHVGDKVMLKVSPWKEINTAYSLPLNMAYRSSVTESESLVFLFDFRAKKFSIQKEPILLIVTKFTLYKEPEREFRSSRRHFTILSLDELRSPDFNLLSDQEYLEEEVAETMTNTFSGSDHEDVNEHIEKVLEIIDLFHIPNITIDQVMRRAFPMSLTRAASRWLRNEPTGFNGDAGAIQAQLNNLGREIKKVNEKFYAAQVGYEQYKGPHYTKDCPLKEEGKTLEEAYYT